MRSEASQAPCRPAALPPCRPALGHCPRSLPRPPRPQAFPSGTTGLFALLFHGGIAAQLGLYFLFWTQLNLVQTLPLALALGAFLAVTGYKALSGLAAERNAAAKKAD